MPAVQFLCSAVPLDTNKGAPPQFEYHFLRFDLLHITPRGSVNIGNGIFGGGMLQKKSVGQWRCWQPESQTILKTESCTIISVLLTA